MTPPHVQYVERHRGCPDKFSPPLLFHIAGSHWEKKKGKKAVAVLLFPGTLPQRGTNKDNPFIFSVLFAGKGVRLRAALTFFFSF
jgi:hypothetical protein